MATPDEFWNELAERYAQKPVDDPEAYERKLVATRALLDPEQVVLDIGCGTGSLALELSPLVSAVHSVDFSREMLRIAEAKASAAGVDNVTFHQAAVAALPDFERASFDVICAFNILHLAEDHRAVLAELFGLLKPGGHLVSTTPCLGDDLVPYGLILPVMKFFGKAPFVRILRGRQLEDDMHATGFVDIKRPPVGASKTVAFLIATKPGA